MKLLLDNGLPRSAAFFLCSKGIEAAHVGDMGLASASDEEILRRAVDGDQVIVTLDADFHTRLALSGASRPSAIRIRREELKGDTLARLVEQVLKTFEAELIAGALISVGPHTARCRALPLR